MRKQYVTPSHNFLDSPTEPNNIEEQDGCESCAHRQKFHIIDCHEGSIICGSCSLVLLNSSFMHSALAKNNPSKSAKVNTGFTSDEKKLLTLLKDWIENGRLPMCVCEVTMHKYQLYNKMFASIYIAKKKVKCDELLAVALFLSLIEEDSQRTPEQIAFITNVADDRILKIAAHIISKTRAQIVINKALRPSAWIPLLGGEMFLTYKQQECLKLLSDEMQTCFSFSPITILLSVSHILFRGVNKIAASKKDLSEIGCVSVPTLSRAIERMAETVGAKINDYPNLVALNAAHIKNVGRNSTKMDI